MSFSPAIRCASSATCGTILGSSTLAGCSPTPPRTPPSTPPSTPPTTPPATPPSTPPSTPSSSDSLDACSGFLVGSIWTVSLTFTTVFFSVFGLLDPAGGGGGGGGGVASASSVSGGSSFSMTQNERAIRAPPTPACSTMEIAMTTL